MGAAYPATPLSGKILDQPAVYPQVFGKYVLERELSRGGMARVILATLRGAGGFEKKLVVKQIRDELAFDQQFVRRFVEEAKTTVALSHPNIVPVYELGVEQGTYFLAMELVEGLSVAELLRERNEDGSRRVLTPEEGAYVGVEVCRALDYAHRRMKVVHRDITPRNVMIDEEGQIKLIDFGIAAPALVAGQEILGSPGHMAPEQVDGRKLGPPTDIFAVAVLLMEAWTGSAPFRRATPEECAAAVREPHPRPSDFDPRLLPLDDAIGRAMNVDPRARQQEASDLARALRSFLQGVDMIDIARTLGDRVREQRELASGMLPASRTSGTIRPPSAGHIELGTKTFAARDEALHWSNPPPDPISSPSTRQLPQSEPRVPVAPGNPDDPAMAIPTPLVVDVEELDRIREDLAARRSERPPSQRPPSRQPPEKIETIATRPLETPVRPSAAPPPPTPAPSRGSLARVVATAVGLALAAAAGIIAWRTRAEPRPQPAVTTATRAPQVVPSASITSTPSATPAPAPSPSETAAPSVVASTAPAPPALSASAGKALVTFLGEPGTRVAIDGSPRGPCPVRVGLAEGHHEVRFTFDPTGESRGERFTVKNGERLTVRAEFTGATPTVKIHR